MAVEHDSYNNIGDIDVYTEFAMLKVKLRLPIIFIGIVGFSPLGRDVRIHDRDGLVNLARQVPFAYPHLVSRPTTPGHQEVKKFGAGDAGRASDCSTVTNYVDS